MKFLKPSIKNFSFLLTVIISAGIAVIFPAMYFITAYQHMTGAVNAELELSARAVEEIIVKNPGSWQFEEIRLQEILEHRLDSQFHDNRIVRDLQGRVIAETKESLARPILTFSQPVYDSGKEVARIEMKRSITPLVIKTVLFGACSAVLGIIIFLVFYYLPLRTVREAYDKLRQSEKKYRLIAEKMTDIVWIADMDLNTVYITPSVRTVLGFSQEEIPKTIDQQITPDSLAVAMEALAGELAVEESGHGNPDRTVNIVLEYYHKDGSTRWLEAIISGLRDDRGVLTGIHGVSRDVTRHKMAEDALRVSEEKFASAFRYSPNVMCITLPPEGRFIDVNDVFLDTLGYKREEIIGRTSSDVSLWVDAAERDAILQEIAETGKVNDVEFRIYDKKGNVRWGLASMSLIKIAGEPHILSQIVDITARKLAEEKFHKIFITTPDLIGISRLKDGLVTDVNKGFEDTLGWKREEIIGERSVDPPINFWVDPAERSFLAEELKAGRDVLHREIQFRRKDGSIRTGVYSARPLNVADEELLIFIMRDVTGQKQMEEKLMEFQKRQLMGQITSGMAHEVRNPLHAIQAISEAMVIDLNEKSDYKEYLSHIKAQVARLSRLINDLLELGKPIQSSQFSEALLSEIAAAALKKWEEAHPRLSQSVKVVNNLQPDDFVLADSDKIQQVVFHLMDNAVHHSPEDGEILLEFGKASENHLRVKIMDKGEGLTAENRSRVFEPFYTTHKGSTGLGLCICKYIIENHGGKIELVDNENAPGCTAQFTLPAYNGRGSG